MPGALIEDTTDKIPGQIIAGGREMKKAIGGLLAVTLVVLILAAISYVRMTSFSCSSSCINNLRQIDSAKEQWALANSGTNGEESAVSAVNQYIKGKTTPVCPQGGIYTYNPIGAPPACSGFDGGWLGARRPHRM